MLPLISSTEQFLLGTALFSQNTEVRLTVVTDVTSHVCLSCRPVQVTEGSGQGSSGEHGEGKGMTTACPLSSAASEVFWKEVAATSLN